MDMRFGVKNVINFIEKIDMPKNIINCVECGRGFFIENHIKLCLFCKSKFDIDRIVKENQIEEFNNGSDRYRAKFFKS